MDATYNLRTIAREALRLVMPDLCQVCQNRTWPGAPYCLSCLRQIRSQSWENWVPYDKSLLQSGSVWGLHTFQGVIPKVIHGIKYSDYPSALQFMGRRMGKKPRPAVLEGAEGLIPVPIHSVRKRERGFNQSERFALAMQKTWGLPVLNRVLKRTRQTPTQTRLSEIERAQNLQAAIVCRDSTEIRGKTLIVVDDVLTTGATLKACEHCLLAAGAKEVRGLVLAWVPKRLDLSLAHSITANH